MGIRKIALGLCLTLAFSRGLRAAGTEALATSDELHKLFDDAQYQPLLQKLVRVLQLKGAAAQPYDRVDLLLLRGETLLRLKQQSAANTAFDDAVKEATVEPTAGSGVAHKPEMVALARATDLLSHKAQAFAYKPKLVDPGVKADPISLLEPDKRMDAFKALLVDTKAELSPKSQAAERAGQLGPIIDLVRNLGDLRAVEFTVTGATKDADALLSTLAERAKTLMSSETDRLAPKVDVISVAAHAKIKHVQSSSSGTGASRTTTYSYTYTMRGLFTADTNDLNSILTECGKILLASRDFAQVTTGAQAQEFRTLAAKVEKVGVFANTTLNDNYSTVSSDPSSTVRGR